MYRCVLRQAAKAGAPIGTLVLGRKVQAEPPRVGSSSLQPLRKSSSSSSSSHLKPSKRRLRQCPLQRKLGHCAWRLLRGAPPASWRAHLQPQLQPQLLHRRLRRRRPRGMHLRIHCGELPR